MSDAAVHRGQVHSKTGVRRRRTDEVIPRQRKGKDPPHTMSPLVGPVVLEPVLVERIWGVHSLQPWHAGTPDKPIGEIWLTAETCTVEGGSHAGMTLAELTEAAGGSFGNVDGDGFPLLLKFLFPREKLSVQVHPNDAEAQALGMPRGKTECWYVLAAEPGAEIALGFGDALTTADVRSAIEDGTIEARLQYLPVKAGDLVLVDAGTVHAIGPGMVVLETQQYSDTTYRLWDYGRPRELHVDAGLAVTRTQTASGIVAPESVEGFTRLVTSPYFIVDRFTLTRESAMALDYPNQLQILIALHDGCALIGSDGEAFRLPYGQALVVPAEDRAYTLDSAGHAEVIRVLQPATVAV